MLQPHAVGCCVTPIVHFATPVDSVNCFPRTKEPTETSITLEDKRVAACCTFHHGIKVPGCSLARNVVITTNLREDGVKGLKLLG